MSWFQRKHVIQTIVVTSLPLLLLGCPNISLNNTTCTPMCDGNTPVSCKDGQSITGVPCGVGTRCQDGVCVLEGDTSTPVDVTDDTTALDTHTTDTTKPDTMTPDTILPDTTKPDTTKPDTGPCTPQCDPYQPCGEDGCGGYCEVAEDTYITCPTGCQGKDAKLLQHVTVYSAVLNTCLLPEPDPQKTAKEFVTELQACIAETDLTEGCGNCFVLILACFSTCAVECASDPGSPCHQACAGENCWVPFFACTGLEGKCVANQNCASEKSCQLNNCEHVGECVELDDNECPPGSPQQCGCDNETYADQCARLKAGVGLKSLGACQQKTE